MSKQIEIERKFLIEMPVLINLDIKKDMDIIQIYLTNGKQNSQRRVRKITEGNNNKYFYTEKIFVSPTHRIENESVISAQEYDEALKEARNDCALVAKRRICFNYSEQIFEMDIYPFSSDLAILEIELDNISQEITIPDCIKVIKEVSDDKRYSNAELATAGAFPSDTI
ncbi:MAG: hypothetical protein IKK66_03135 [Ruminococcus sp.]|nr:hypothetical protein [Ruminococcus sp.]